MKPWLILIALLLGGILLPGGGRPRPAAQGLDASLRPSRFGAMARRGRSCRSRAASAPQSVWASGACWSECGSYCAWGMAGCLERDAQGQCLKLTDKCDRYCQRECRTSGGPLLPIEFFWD